MSIDTKNESSITSIIDEYRRLTLQEIAREANKSTMSVQHIMKNLLQKKVCAQWVPHCLNADQHKQHIATARHLLGGYKVEGKRFYNVL